MASNRIFNLGPVFIASAAGNLMNPPTTGGTGFGIGGTLDLYIVIRHFRILNKDSTARTFTLYKGASGASTAGTEVVGGTQSVAANTSYDWYGIMRFDVADFLVGVASSASTLVIQGEGEIGVK